MALASKKAILDLEDLGAPVKLHIPEWGDDVYLRRPTANDRDAWELYCEEHKRQPHKVWRAKLASLVLCDEEGKLLFTEREIEQLGHKSAAALHRIWQEALKLFRITEEEVAELEKN
jgi:hypothetical protein